VGDNPNIQIWHDTPELARQGVTIGPVTGADASQQAQSVQDMAQRLNADMILYGNIDQASETPQVTLQIWIAPDPQFGFNLFEGLFQFGIPVSFVNSEDSVLPAELSNQVKASAWIALGLAEEQLGHSLESVEAFSKAGDFHPADIIHFFTGQGYLFLVDRENITDVAKLAFDQAAEQEFQKAIDQNPQNARAIVGWHRFLALQRKMLTIQTNTWGPSIDTELMSNTSWPSNYQRPST
jgi:tetratricopeptide (TPR) repeat protein